MRLLLAILLASHLVRPPGATNPAVRQNTVQTTICVRGYSASVRPPLSYTGPLKHVWAHQEGVTAAGYQLDHLIPLELGGAPRNTRNLWLEALPDAHQKDHQENLLHREVCAGTISLARARAQMRGWSG